MAIAMYSSCNNKLLYHHHLKCELNMLTSRHLDAEYHSGLFLRCYLSTGVGRYVRVDSGEIPTTVASCRSSTAALLSTRPLAVIESQGDAGHMSKLLEEQSIIIELRQRKAAAYSLLGRRFSGSKLLGRASVAWKEMTSTVSVDGGKSRCITVAVEDRSRMADNQKPPPAILVEMKTWLSEKAASKRRASTHVQLEECRCRYCEWNLEEEDMLALAHEQHAC